ncbi:MAG TPA: Hsp33 family molecular chaperone HslO [Steroidobacteraceae bacterium]|jgi:molecular chaperone Hsp33|nr:Hsp33 family molecular chaperone HslO [Steroidobacteraceae bacterium]
MESATTPRDEVRRFIVENRPVRGHWVRLEGAWRELRAHRDYPQPVRELLGQAVAASVLLAATLKFRGQLTLQLQGNGAVSLLVAQCTHDYRLRAVARFDAAAVAALSADGVAEDPAREADGVFRRLVGSEGRIAVTVEADERNTRYQGIVPLSGDSLAGSLEAYFARSEQLPTRVLLAADGERGAGVLVQKLPEDAATDETQMSEIWEQAERGIERLSPEDLLRCPVEELLGRGFAAHDMRLFRGAPVQFECRCSHGRVTSLLRALGPDEVRDVLREQGSVTVTCEFCHRPYRFDAGDVEALFGDGSAPGGNSSTIH